MNIQPRISQFLWIALSCLMLASCRNETRRQFYEAEERTTVSDRQYRAAYGDSVEVRLLDSTLVDIRKQLQSMDSK